MFKRLDQSPLFARFLEWMSSTLARQRGLLVVIGVMLITFSFIIDLVNRASPSTTLSLIWSVSHHVGLIMAFIGILMVEPLGR